MDDAQPGTPTTDETGPTGDGPAENSSTDAGQDTAAATAGDDGSAAAQEKPKRGRPKGSSARTTRVVSLTLTVSGSADGEWQAELKNGSSWVARGLPITAAAVSRAAAELHSDLSGPIDEVIETARAAKAARVAELEAELEQAKKALAELE